MSILDTFYILFKTDADKATAEMAGLEAAEEGVALKAGVADAAVASLGGSFVTLAAQLAAPILAFASLGGAISLALSRVNEVDDIGDAAFKLGSTTEQYDAISRAAKAAGVGAADFQSNLAMFSDKLNDAAARPDGPNAKNFAKWGIHFRDVHGEALGAVDGILALSKSLEKVPHAEALGRLRRLGIRDSDTIGFILQGTKAIKEQMQAQIDAGVVTDEQIQIAGDYQVAIGKTNNVLDTFSNRLVEALIPAITSALNTLSTWGQWLLDHELLVKGFFIGIAGVVTAVFLPALAQAAAATIAATWPFLAIAAAVIAFGSAVALVYEDIEAYLHGQNSLIGELIKKYQWLIDDVTAAWNKIEAVFAEAWAIIEPILQSIANGAKSIIDGYIAIYEPIYNAFKNLFSAVGDLADAVRDRILEGLSAVLPGWIEKFDQMKTTFGDAFSEMLTRIQPLVDGVRTAAGAIEEIFRTMAAIIKEIWAATIGWIADGINNIANRIQGIAGAVRSGDPAVGQGIKNTLGSIMPAAPVDPDSPGAVIGRMNGFGRQGATLGAAANQNTVNTNVNVGTVNVQTQATDAAGVAAAVRGELQQQLRATASHYDDGVNR